VRYVVLMAFNLVSGGSRKARPQYCFKRLLPDGLSRGYVGRGSQRGDDAKRDITLVIEEAAGADPDFSCLLATTDECPRSEPNRTK
jgi:hypothetical protein